MHVLKFQPLSFYCYVSNALIQILSFEIFKYTHNDYTYRSLGYILPIKKVVSCGVYDDLKAE